MLHPRCICSAINLGASCGAKLPFLLVRHHGTDEAISRNCRAFHFLRRLPPHLGAREVCRSYHQSTRPSVNKAGDQMKKPRHSSGVDECRGKTDPTWWTAGGAGFQAASGHLTPWQASSSRNISIPQFERCLRLTAQVVITHHQCRLDPGQNTNSTPRQIRPAPSIRR